MKRLSLAAVWVLTLLVGPLDGQTGDKPRTVRDEAGLFSSAAKEKADALIARYKSNFKRDLLIETVQTIPIPDGVKKDDAVDAWAAKRAEEVPDGIYLGIIVDPPKYRIHVAAEARHAFTVENRKELEKILVTHLKSKEMDQALTDVAGYVFEMTRRNGLIAAGLKVHDDKVGTGPGAKRGDTLTMTYVGKLKDGKTFDKTLDPVTFVLKEGIFIKGFEQGVVGMKAGGVRRLIVPAGLAYGKEGVGDIPPGAELHFEIEMLKIN